MSELHAALDLGSNSFHLLVARRQDDVFLTVERQKGKVQLLSGFRDGRLTDAALARGIACLERFAQRVASVPRDNVYVAGTHALREAVNRDVFVEHAERILGAPLRVVSGEDEARLIYLGVAHHTVSHEGETRLVVDIGGGSTEIASGGNGSAERVESLKVGCVALTDRFFTADATQESAFAAARDHARAAFAAMRWDAVGGDVIGTSGTIESVQAVLAANGWGAERITPASLGLLSDAIASRRWLVDAGLPGLAPDRVDIFPAGVALLSALFEVLEIPSMRFVDASLQDGLLYERFGPPEAGCDLRQRTIRALQQRYRVDTAQAVRVRRTALALFAGTASWWPEAGPWRRLLGWAADLHLTGMLVSARHYHRHGAYLLKNSELQGFSRSEQEQLALLVRGHRRSFPGLAFGAFEPDTGHYLTRLLALLRVAVILERSQTDADSPPVSAQGSADRLTLHIEPAWLAAHPLSQAELQMEAGQLASAGVQLILA